MIVTDEVLDCFENVAAAKGTNAKKVLLKEYLRNLYFSTLLSMTFNPYQSFHVVKVPKTKKEERKPIEPREAWKTFILNADLCSKREVTGNAAIALMQETFSQSSEAQEKWMRKVLKKSLAIGVSTKTLNKVQSNFIPTFDVALAQKFDMKRIKSSEIFIEPKLDGIRCLAIVENREAKLYTRAGKLITNFDDTVGKELSKFNDGCYDGEIMSTDFTELMRQVYRKEDILAMGQIAVNPGFGKGGASKYSIWLYKGGPRCFHRWTRKIYLRKDGGSFGDAKRISTRQAGKQGFKPESNDNKVSIAPRNMTYEGYTAAYWKKKGFTYSNK